MRQLTLMISIVFCTEIAAAQSDSSLIREIKVYVEYIDSINSISHANSLGFSTLIEDGVIKKKRKIIGGFGIYTLSSSNKDTVYRIEYNGGASITLNKIYFFRNNKLIYARLRLIANKQSGSIYDRTEYYQKGTLIKTVLYQQKSATIYSNQTNLALYKDGLTLLTRYNEEYNRH